MVFPKTDGHDSQDEYDSDEQRCDTREDTLDQHKDFTNRIESSLPSTAARLERVSGR